MRARKLLFVPLLISFLMLFSVVPIQYAAAAPSNIVATNTQAPVTIDGVAQPGEWSAATAVTVPTAQMTAAFEYNATGLLFMLQWSNGTVFCHTSSCFGGIELGFVNNTGSMGSSLSPTIMILLSPSFKGGYDEFVSQGDVTPATVESQGYKTQSTCALALNGTTFTGECYRPFKLSGASPYDPFPVLVSGSSIEIGFAVGNFASPGQHSATDMASYTLTLGPATTTTTTTTTSSSGSGTSTSQTTSTTPTTPTTPTTTTTTLTTTTTTTKSVASTPATIYGEELAILVVGFAVIMILVLRRYQGS
jgi:hypothetical protein